MNYRRIVDRRIAIPALLVLWIAGCGQSGAGRERMDMQSPGNEDSMKSTSNGGIPAGGDTAVLGAGCFWCVEAVFQRLEGVSSVEAGYAGGTTDNPTYEQVCTGGTGHAEVARIVFDPEKISFDALLDAFWQAHDPTTLNRQGADAGTQYRSAIFYQSEEQRIKAEASRARAQAEFADPIVTEISRLERFYPAENYHQDYYNKNRNAPYCQFVIRPKLKKLNLE